MRKKKILFVGHSLSPFSSSILKNLRLLDFEVSYFDHYSPSLWSKVLGAVRNTVLPTSSLIRKKIRSNINEVFYTKVLKYKPDYILIFKGKDIYSSTIREVRDRGYIVINWFPDYYDDWDWIKSNASVYDFFFTPCLYVLNKLKEIGIHSYYLPFATDPDVVYPNTPKRYNATFVGRFTERRKRLFKEVFKAGLLDVWGYKHWLHSIYREKYHGQVTPEECKEIIRKSKITLNTLTATDKTPIISVNYRIFEATGVGGFILSWYNSPMEEFFKIGKEIDVFKSAGEALEKTKYYLEHDALREKIAKAGWKRAMKDHTYGKRLKQLFSHIK